MPKAVVMGAKLQCTCGSLPSQLVVNSQTQVTIEHKLAATVMDQKPLLNILPFGTCSILTAAALGTPVPCLPSPAGPWMPGSQAKVTIGNQPVLLATDLLQCTVPGLITITDPGQTSTDDK